MHDGHTIVRKRMSFLSVAILSMTAIIVTVVVSASGIVVYGLSVVDRKTDDLSDFVTEAANSLPAIREALPPAISDAFEDERHPGYFDDLVVSVKLLETGHQGRYRRAMVEVENKGDSVVTLLSLRVIGFDEDGNAIVEENEWAATPLAIEDDWRGPIQPRQVRQFPVWLHNWHGDLAEISHEITDIRVWDGESTETALAESA